MPPREACTFRGRVILMARPTFTEEWERVAETPFEPGERVAATFKAHEHADLEFQVWIETPWQNELEIWPWEGTDGPMRSIMNPGDLVIARVGPLSVA